MKVVGCLSLMLAVFGVGVASMRDEYEELMDFQDRLLAELDRRASLLEPYSHTAPNALVGHLARAIRHVYHGRLSSVLEENPSNLVRAFTRAYNSASVAVHEILTTLTEMASNPWGSKINDLVVNITRTIHEGELELAQLGKARHEYSLKPYHF